MDERLKRLIARREAAAQERETLLAKRKAIVDLAEEESRQDLSDEEDAEFRKYTADLALKDTEIKGYDERIKELSDELERDAQVTAGAAAVRRAQSRVDSISEKRTYEKGNGYSYLRDLVRHQLNHDGDGTSYGRLQRHAAEVATDPEFRAMNRTDGTGGFFVPPLWLMNEWVALARAGRAYANLVANQPLPPGTDSINIPVVATGAVTQLQASDNATVTSTDITDSSISAPVRTVVGQQDVAIQLIDQSPVNFDEIVFQDLIADYATRVDLQVIQGTGSSGQVTGVRNTASIQTISSSTATIASVYNKIADAVQRVHTQRFLPPTALVMHPRRWAWFLGSVDSSGRPLVLPDAYGQVNVMGTVSAVASQQVVGSMHGLPVVTDPSIPTTLGASTTEDVIHILRASDSILWESSIRTRVLPEVLSGTLSTRLQVYGYIAFSAARYPKAVVEIGGPALVAPTFP